MIHITPGWRPPHSSAQRNATPPAHDAWAKFTLLFDEHNACKCDEDIAAAHAELYRVAQSARAGGRHEIELLTNLAMRDDTLGQVAEVELFGIFSDADVEPSLREEVSRTVHSLWKFLSRCPANSSFAGAQAKFSYASILLYMAGAAANAGDQNHLSENIFTKGAQNQNQQVGEDNIWAVNREVTSDELGCTARLMNRKSCRQPCGAEHFNYPMALAQKTLQESIQQIIKQSASPNWPQYFPVNTGGHWVLLGIHDSIAGAGPQAFVFSSLPLSEATKMELSSNLANAGIVGNVEWIDDKGLQEYAPNGCGVFVAQAMKELAAAPIDKAVGTLKKLQQEAYERSASATQEWALLARRSLYGDMLQQEAEAAAARIK